MNSSIPHLMNSILILKNHLLLLMLLLVSSVSIILPMAQKSENVAYYLLPALIMLVVSFLIYGQFSEIALRNRQAKYSSLFKRHCANYIIVTIILGLPSVFIDILRVLFEFELDLKYLDILCSFLVTSITIYIFPLVFILERRWKSIKIGFQCLLGNLRFSLPLLLIVGGNSAIGLFFLHQGSKENYNLHVLSYGFFIIFGLLIDLWVFISATLILKEKGLANS